MGKTAWVAGASGLVGGHLMTQLAAHPAYEKVIALVRSPVNAGWAALPKVKQHVVDWDALKNNIEQNGLSTVERNGLDNAEQDELASPVDDLFCALGTTKKKTPDSKQYYQIDVEYPLVFADIGLQHGATFYGLVSAHGAKAKSLSSYLKMKGQLETQLTGKTFSHQAIARPGLLKGDRQESRLGEQLGEIFTNRLPGNYKAIYAYDVAAALIASANTSMNGISLLSSSSMQGAKNRAR